MNEPEHFRLFIAIPIPRDVRAKIEDAQAQLRRALPDSHVRWTRPEQFHLTLKFLGDVEAGRLEALADATREACRGFTPLRLRAGDVGCFPDPRRPRVLWVGVRDETEQLLRLQAAVDLASRPFVAEEKEEHFSSHVTLARFKGIRPADAKALGDAASSLKDKPLGEWLACEVEIIRSRLSSAGARHETLLALRLG